MFAVGTKVWYSDRIHGRRPAIVLDADENIKNGLPGYEIQCTDALAESDEFEQYKWGYASQFSLRN